MDAELPSCHKNRGYARILFEYPAVDHQKQCGQGYNYIHQSITPTPLFHRLDLKRDMGRVESTHHSPGAPNALYAIVYTLDSMIFAIKSHDAFSVMMRIKRFPLSKSGPRWNSKYTDLYHPVANITTPASSSDPLLKTMLRSVK
jgi:hypothetical protein